MMHALGRDAEEGAVDREIGRLPRRLRRTHKRRPSTSVVSIKRRRRSTPREPAARHEGVEVGVVRVLGEDLVELQRPDAERLVERESERRAGSGRSGRDGRCRSSARAMARSLNRSATLLDRQQRGDHERQRRRCPQSRSARCACARWRSGVVTKVSTISSAAANANWPQAAREKVSSSAEAMSASSNEARIAHAEPTAQHALEERASRAGPGTRRARSDR